MYFIRGHVQTTWTTKGGGGVGSEMTTIVYKGGGGVKALSTWTKTLSISLMFIQLLM